MSLKNGPYIIKSVRYEDSDSDGDGLKVSPGALYTVRKGCRVFLISWRGNKVPDGAIVLGREITWTQDGKVAAKHRSPYESLTEGIGTYERLVEFGGPDGLHHEIRVFIRPEAAQSANNG